MKSHELRIGNWIEKDGKQYQATALTIFCLGKQHKPIPLTDEWLFKFGFVYVADFDEWRYEESTHWFNVFCSEFNEWLFDKPEMASVKIEYVHQLQNLYFALTQKELQIK